MQNEWKKNYWDLLYETCTSENIAKARKIRHENFSSSLYRYRSLNKFSLYELQFNTVWLSCPNDFNDPYDTRFNLNTLEQITSNLFKSKSYFEEVYGALLKSLNIDIDKYYDIALSKDNPLSFLFNDLLKQEYPNIDLDWYEPIRKVAIESEHEYLYSYKSKWAISCFSEVNNSILMWSHYSDSHRGFCIEYDFKNSSLKYKDLIRPVVYDDKIVTFDKSKEPFYFLGVLTKKSKCWEYENEWRLAIDYDIVKDNRNFKVPNPKAIYLGCKISNNDKEQLLSIAESKKIKVYQMEMSTTEFKLTYREIL